MRSVEPTNTGCVLPNDADCEQGPCHFCGAERPLCFVELEYGLAIAPRYTACAECLADFVASQMCVVRVRKAGVYVETVGTLRGELMQPLPQLLDIAADPRLIMTPPSSDAAAAAAPACTTCRGASVATNFRACPPCRAITLLDAEPSERCVLCGAPMLPLWWCAACQHCFHVPPAAAAV